MIDIIKMIRNGEMPKDFYKKLADDFKDEPPKNSRMRFEFDAPFKGEIYKSEHVYTLTVTEYADVCDGETLTAKGVCCQDTAKIIEKGLIPFNNRSLSFIENQLREQFDSLDTFMDFCDKNDIDYKKLPLWVDEHSYNEHTGEHRGEYAPFAFNKNESGDEKI